MTASISSIRVGSTHHRRYPRKPASARSAELADLNQRPGPGHQQSIPDLNRRRDREGGSDVRHHNRRCPGKGPTDGLSWPSDREVASGATITPVEPHRWVAHKAPE